MNFLLLDYESKEGYCFLLSLEAAPKFIEKQLWFQSSYLSFVFK